MAELNLSLGAAKFRRHLVEYFDQFEDDETWTTEEVVSEIDKQYETWKSKHQEE